jgi:hypothetical protein
MTSRFFCFGLKSESSSAASKSQPSSAAAWFGVWAVAAGAGRVQEGNCVQRVDLCFLVEEFVRSDLREEILALRETEFRKLAAKYGAEGA